MSVAHSQPARVPHKGEQHREYRDDRGHRHKDNAGHKDVHHGKKHKGPHNFVKPENHGGPRVDFRREVYCNEDWQELWNGRHVRLKMNQVWIYKRNGDDLLHGDEVILLPLGSYCVRRGDLWHIYDEDGDWLTGISSPRVIEQLWNGCYLYERGGRYYVADERGDRIFNVWGEWVELMDNGLFRCHRNRRNYYYDKFGNQRE